MKKLISIFFLVILFSLRFEEFKACTQPPPDTPSVTLQRYSPTTACIIIYRYTSFGADSTNFCGCALNSVNPIISVDAVLITDTNNVPIPGFPFVFNPNTGPSFNSHQPGNWKGFFSDIQQLIPSNIPLKIQIMVTIPPNTSSIDQLQLLATNLASLPYFFASDEVNSNGMVLNTHLQFRRAGTITILGGSPSTQVVPNAYAAIPGTATFLGPLANAPRTYQLLIQASQLTGLIGRNLTGFHMRIPASATANWPLTVVTYTNYDIYLSGSREPSNRSLTFDSNVVGPRTQVRSGPLTIPTNSYTFGASPNAFGPEITFNTPWLYSGGNLLVEIRHPGFTGTSRSTDAISTSTGGYGTLISGCWTASYTGTVGGQANFTIIKLNAALTLRLTALIEGLYNGGTNIMVSDTAKVYLRNDFTPYDIVDSAVSVLDTNGRGSFRFLNAVNDVKYYLVVDQRNSINTWSDSGKSFTEDTLDYDFTTSASQAFGNNLVLKGSRYAIYSGDVNKDGVVDGADLSLIDNASFNFLTGYVVQDLNGDLIVDGSDAAIGDNNAANFVTEIRP